MGGFGAAAEAIRVGQPTVSEQVKALESEYGVELFYRQGRNVRLTSVGHSLFAITQNYFGIEDEADKLLTQAREFSAGELKIGASSPYGIMGIVKAVRTAYPDLRLTVAVDHHEDIRQKLLGFDIDVAMIGRAESDPRIYTEPYARLRVDIVVGLDHPWAARKSIPIRELEGQDMVLREPSSTTRQAFEHATERAGVNTHTVMEIDSREALREAIMQGIGIGVGQAIEIDAHRGLRWIPVEDETMETAFQLACLKNRRDRPLIQTFFELAQTVDLATH